MISSAISSDRSSERIRQEALHPEKWKNPKPAEQYDLVIVGVGPASAMAADEAARLGAKVALIERNLLGGNCLNTGCIPSKTIIRTSRLYAEMRNAEDYGAKTPGEIAVDFAAAMEHVRSVRARLARNMSVKGLAAHGVNVFFAEARFAGPDLAATASSSMKHSTA